MVASDYLSYSTYFSLSRVDSQFGNEISGRHTVPFIRNRSVLYMFSEGSKMYFYYICRQNNTQILIY